MPRGEVSRRTIKRPENGSEKLLPRATHGRRLSSRCCSHGSGGIAFFGIHHKWKGVSWSYERMIYIERTASSHRESISTKSQPVSQPRKDNQRMLSMTKRKKSGSVSERAQYQMRGDFLPTGTPSPHAAGAHDTSIRPPFRAWRKSAAEASFRKISSLPSLLISADGCSAIPSL